MATHRPILRRLLAVAVGASLLPGCASLGTTNQNGIALVQSGAYAQAEPVLRRALASEERASGPDSVPTSNVLFNLGWLYQLEGRYTEAEPLLRRAVLIQDRAGGAARSFLAGSLNEYGYVLLQEGRYGDAEPLFRRAIALQEQSAGGTGADLAVSTENLGYLFRRQGRYDEARPLYERALAIRERALGPNSPLVARTLTNLGTLDVLQARPHEAEPLEQRALRIRETALGPSHPQVADSLYDLGTLYRTERRFADSEQAFRRGIAVQAAASGPHHPIVATRGYAGLVQLFKDQGRQADALAASDQAAAILEQQLTDGRGQRSTGAVSERRIYRDIFLDNIALTYAAGQDRVARSFLVAQYAAAVNAAQALAHMAAQFATEDGALAASIRRLQDLGDRWRELDAQLLKAVSTPAANRAESFSDTLRVSLEATDRDLAALTEQIERQFPEFADITNLRPIPLAETQRMLGPDEAMLVYLAGPDASWLWAVRNNSAQLYRLNLTADELAGEVAALRSFLDPDSNPSLRPFPARRAYGLYQRILAPADSVIRGAHKLLVVADGALASLPLSVLVTSPPAADPATAADHRNVHWLAQDYAVAVLPSVASLHALRTVAHASRASSPFFGVGNPALGGSVSGSDRGAVAGLGPVLAPSLSIQQLRSGLSRSETTRAVANLAPLPETATELEAIAQIERASSQDLLLGRRATEAELRATPLAHYRVIEFATHGLKPGDLGLDEPALVLTPTGRSDAVDDGLLTASKIGTLRLDADWVVLSACNTAASAGPESEGFSALATAFFHAGARSVLISHWSVPSGPTVLLTAGAFAQLADNPGISRSEALRRSMMAMLSPSRPAEFAHPLVWAPFSLAGDVNR